MLAHLYICYYACLTWAYLLQRANHWFIDLGLLGPTLGLLLPTDKSLGLLLWACSGIPWAYLCQRANHLVYCFGPTRAYLGPPFANEQISGFIALGLLGPTLALPLPTSKSVGLLLWAHSGLPRSYLCQPAYSLETTGLRIYVCTRKVRTLPGKT